MQKIVCWDLDETLGVFGYEERTLRYHAKETLEFLLKKNYRHYIASAAERNYIIDILKSTGIENLFHGIFDRNSIKPNLGPKEGKLYSAIVVAENLSSKEIEDRMIVIGNSDYDQPVDVDNLVFIQDARYGDSKSNIVRKIFEKLENLDNSSFKRAFDKWYRSSDLLIDNFKIKLSYEKNKYNSFITPKIYFSKGSPRS